MSKLLTDQDEYNEQSENIDNLEQGFNTPNNE